VKIYTINGAWQDHMEHVKGSIEVGKLADLCILEKDLFSVDPHELHDIPVLMTIAGGKIVFDNLSR
jgi:predicted amidohydrolase YtcJ